MMDTNNIKSDVELNEKEGTSRREFFEKFGKFALYTPPAVMVLMSVQTEAGSKFHSLSSSSNVPVSTSLGSSSNEPVTKSRLQRSERKASRLQKPEENR